MRENKLSNHPYLNIKSPTEPRITYLFLSPVREYFAMETGSISVTSANEPSQKKGEKEGRENSKICQNLCSMWFLKSFITVSSA